MKPSDPGTAEHDGTSLCSVSHDCAAGDRKKQIVKFRIKFFFYGGVILWQKLEGKSLSKDHNSFVFWMGHLRHWTLLVIVKDQYSQLVYLNKRIK